MESKREKGVRVRSFYGDYNNNNKKISSFMLFPLIITKYYVENFS